MKRLLAASAALIFVAGCSNSDLTTGPETLDTPGNITTAGPPGGPSGQFGHSDVCGYLTVPAGDLAGVQVASPCDGDSNIGGVAGGPDPDKLPYTGQTFWLSSLEANPSPIPANFSGLASRLHVKAYPYPNEQACTAAANAQGLNGVNCGVRDLAVTEVVDGTTGASIRYETAWKSKKSKSGGPGAGDFLPDNTYWQIVLFLDFDGAGVDATGVPGDRDDDIASRIIKWTSTPSSDNPLNGWSLDINWGSNQPIPFVLEDNQSGCFGTARDFLEVECLIDTDRGATLIVETPLGGQGVEIGPGNQFGLRTLKGEVCTDANGQPRDVDVDTKVFGTCVEWTFDPPLPQGPGNELIDSFIYACENLGPVGAATFVMEDGLGAQALPPISLGDVNAFCNTNLLPDQNFAMGDPGTGLQFVLNKIKRFFAPSTAIATDGSSGSRLLTSRSSFQVAETAILRDASASTPAAENSTTTISASVESHEVGDPDSGPVADAIVYAYSAAADPNTSVACNAAFPAPSSSSDPGPWCQDLTAAELSANSLSGWADDGVRIKTGPLGAASVEATVGTVPAEFRWLGCNLAVPGTDTPANGGTPAGPCDRDPGDPDDGTAGYANGIAAGLDPFMKDGVVVLEWVNDLPLRTTVQVCSAPAVDGVKDANDPWSQGNPSSCIPSGFRDSFEVNVGGNLGGNSGPVIADLEWIVAGGSVFFGLEVPLDSDPTSKKVNVGISFDAGDGSSAGTSNVFDDQIEISLDKFSAVSTGDVFDRYLTASCAGNNSTSLCNALDTDVGGLNNAVGAMKWNSTNNTLFIEFGQSLDGDDPVDLHGLVSGETLGFILQLGVGNVQQGGTVFPEQVNGKTYKSFQIP